MLKLVHAGLTTVGTASAMYMICQPLSPNMPSRSKECRGYRRSGGHRDRQPDHKARDDAGMMIAGKPVGEVQQKARKESGLGGAQQEADE